MSDDTRKTTHFVKRWNDRGDPAAINGWTLQALLGREIPLAMADPSAPSIVEYVLTLPQRGQTLWRFRIKEGPPYYALYGPELAKLITIIPQDMLETYKDAARHRASGVLAAKSRKQDIEINKSALQRQRRMRTAKRAK